MKRLMVYGMGLIFSMAVVSTAFAGNDKTCDGNKTTTCKDKKACNGKCSNKKCCNKNATKTN